MLGVKSPSFHRLVEVEFFLSVEVLESSQESNDDGWFLFRFVLGRPRC